VLFYDILYGANDGADWFNDRVLLGVIAKLALEGCAVGGAHIGV
jgi:hypothetical protein